jgi:hypothetical protein
MSVRRILADAFGRKLIVKRQACHYAITGNRFAAVRCAKMLRYLSIFHSQQTCRMRLMGSIISFLPSYIKGGP